MESIKEVNKQFRTNDLNRELLQEYVKSLKDDDFKKLVTRLKLTERVAMKYTAKLEMSVCELKNCNKCKGLSDCKNKVNGCVYYPKVNDNTISFDYVACKYKKEQIENDKLKPIVFEEPLAIREARMADIDLTDKKRAHVIKWVQKFYKDFEKNKNIKGIYLHGNFGSGKSYILAALINELAKKGNKCVIMYYPDMLVRLKESFSDDFDVKMHNLKTCDVLMIDDIGAESVTQWSRDEILGTILQYRMDAKLPVFFTSNLDINELETHLSQTRNGIEIVKAKRIIERIKYLTDDLELISENRRK